MARTPAENTAASARVYFMCTRCVDSGCFASDKPPRRSITGRIGRAVNPPPQFGQTLWSTVSTQSAQNVHS